LPSSRGYRFGIGFNWVGLWAARWAAPWDARPGESRWVFLHSFLFLLLFFVF
jgi:hypothetical protein